jgi:hypothetical protein
MPKIVAIILTPRPNPKIVSFNASVVKIYNATSSLVRFQNKTIFFLFENSAAVVLVNSEVTGLAPGVYPTLTYLWYGCITGIFKIFAERSRKPPVAVFLRN